MGSTPQPNPPTAGRRRWPAYLFGLASGLLLAAAVGLVAAGPLALAHRGELPLERAYGALAVSLAARLNAGTATSPLVGDSRATSTGRAAYAGSCAVCHGAKGDGRGVFGQASYPPATNLTDGGATGKSDAEVFWIVKNGLSFAGMPAFGGLYDDRDLWGIVGYLRTLGRARASAAAPTPTAAQLAAADPAGDATQRGAATYFAMNCAACHGPAGDASGDLALRGEDDLEEAVREGKEGMPAYGEALLSAAELRDLSAYLGTFGGGQRRRD